MFKNRGFTDRLYWLNFKCVWAFTIACFVLTLFCYIYAIVNHYEQAPDLAIVVYGIPAAWAELSVHTGYIIWKAKNENINRHNGKIGKKETINYEE